MGQFSRGGSCLLSLLAACVVVSPAAAAVPETPENRVLENAVGENGANASTALSATLSADLQSHPLQVSASSLNADHSRLVAVAPLQLAQATPSVTYPILQRGSTGETVSRLQATLQLLGFYQGPIDGTFTEATAAAVAQFQTAAGLQADSVVGPATWQKLLPQPGAIATNPVPPQSPAPTPQPSETPTPPDTTAEAPSGPPILRPDVEGPAVAQLQRELQTLDYYDGPIDGIYGPQTQAAVIQFQTDQQLEVDAIVGPSTWDALTRALES